MNKNNIKYVLGTIASIMMLGVNGITGNAATKTIDINLEKEKVSLSLLEPKI